MPGSATVTINDKQWAVDVAASPSELAAGLGGVASIAANTGMLFDLGSEQTVQVTTEPMLFNIDIIFISEDLKVVDVVSDVAPGYLLTEDTPVRFFLEVNAGEAEGIEAGDDVQITDYQYTPPSTISQWMPTIIGISILGFVGAMVGGVASGMFGHHSSPGKLHRKAPKELGQAKDLMRKWHERGIEAGRTDGWMDIEKTIKETAEKHPEIKEVSDLVLTDIDEWESTDHFRILYGSKIWEDAKGDISLASDLKAEFWEGYLAGRKDIGMDIYKIASELVKSKSRPTVTCPLCSDVIEIPEWDKVSRSEALRKHLQEKHGRHSDKKLWYLGEWWEEEYSTAECIVYRSADGKKRLYVYWDGTKEVKPMQEERHSSSGPEITSEERQRAEAMWQVTKEDAEAGEPAGVYLWTLLNKYYLGDKEKQILFMGFLNEVQEKYKGHIPREEAWRLARKWDVERMLAKEVMEFFSGHGSATHHSMWLSPEQRKGLQEKYGAVAVRWAEEATRSGDIKGVEVAAEYYYRKLKEVFGLGHLSPVLTEEQIRKLREVLGLTASVTEVLKIHRETGYIP